MDSIALGLLSRRGGEEGSLGEVDDTTTTLLYASLHSSNAARSLKMLKMLVFDRTRLSPLFRHSAVQSTDTTFPFDTNAYLE